MRLKRNAKKFIFIAILKSIAVIISGGLCLWKVFLNVEEYFQRKIEEIPSIDTVKMLYFPTVTLCPTEVLNPDKLRNGFLFPGS